MKKFLAALLCIILSISLLSCDHIEYEENEDTTRKPKETTEISTEEQTKENTEEQTKEETTEIPEFAVRSENENIEIALITGSVGNITPPSKNPGDLKSWENGFYLSHIIDLSHKYYFGTSELTLPLPTNPEISDDNSSFSISYPTYGSDGRINSFLPVAYGVNYNSRKIDFSTSDRYGFRVLGASDRYNYSEQYGFAIDLAFSSAEATKLIFSDSYLYFSSERYIEEKQMKNILSNIRMILLDSENNSVVLTATLHPDFIEETTNGWRAAIVFEGDITEKQICDLGDTPDYYSLIFYMDGRNVVNSDMLTASGIEISGFDICFK